MSELIDRQAALDAIKFAELGREYDEVEKVPSVDAVLVVRCKECIHFTQGGWCDREFDWFPVGNNDFCSMAEKMEVQE